MSKRSVVVNPVYEGIDRFQHQAFQLLYIDGMKLPAATTFFQSLIQRLNAEEGTQRKTLTYEMWQTRVRIWKGYWNLKGDGPSSEILAELDKQELWYQDPENCKVLRLPVALEERAPLSVRWESRKEYLEAERTKKEQTTRQGQARTDSKSKVMDKNATSSLDPNVGDPQAGQTKVKDSVGSSIPQSSAFHQALSSSWDAGPPGNQFSLPLEEGASLPKTSKFCIRSPPISHCFHPYGNPQETLWLSQIDPPGRDFSSLDDDDRRRYMEWGEM